MYRYPTETGTIKPQQYNHINGYAKPFQEGITGILVPDQTAADQLLGLHITEVSMNMCHTICSNYRKQSIALSPHTPIGILQKTPLDVRLS